MILFVLWFKPCSSSSQNTPKQKNKFFRFFFLFIISENFIRLHIKVTALRLSNCLSTPKNHLMSSAENLIKHNEAEINPFMKYRYIFYKKTYLMLLCQAIHITVTMQFPSSYSHRKIYDRRNPWRPSSPKVDTGPDMVWQVPNREE